MANKKYYPYIDSPNRLSDVIAAIQVMGTYKFYTLSFEKWAARIRELKLLKSRG